MSSFGVYSEVGKLRKVIVHRPELSLQRLTPSNHDALLFDDVLWVERAQWEHDQFTQVMRERGVQVFYVLDLLRETLEASPQARELIIYQVATEYTVGWALVDEMRRFLQELPADRLAVHLIGGLTAGEAGLDWKKFSQHLPARRRPGRHECLPAAAPAEYALHPRFLLLDLRGCLCQPDVLARPPARSP